MTERAGQGARWPAVSRQRVNRRKVGSPFGRALTLQINVEPQKPPKKASGG